MAKLKASERLDYWLSDIYDIFDNAYSFFVKWFIILTCIPLSIITVISVIAGVFHYSIFFSPCFFNLSWYYYPIWLLTLPIIIPIIWFFIVFFIIGAIFGTLFVEFIKGLFK